MKMKRRRKINNICRCTPKEGVIGLHPDYAKQVFDEQLSLILCCSNPGFIADHAILIGNILYQCGRPLLALELMKQALAHLLHVDDDLQRDYAENHYWPHNPDYYQWYHPWSARVSETDARKLAARIDEVQNDITKHLGYKNRSLLRFRVHRYYENMFNDIYEV